MPNAYHSSGQRTNGRISWRFVKAVFALACIATSGGIGLTPANASNSLQDSKNPAHPTGVNAACYSQYDNDNGNGANSQRYVGGGNPTLYTDRGADDFTLTSRCTAQSIDVAGQYYNGAGATHTVRVRFYLPNTATPTCPCRTRLVTAPNFTDNMGNFHIPLVPPVSLAAGTHWVSVRSRVVNGDGDTWNWNTNNTLRGTPAEWVNPLNGYGTGCTTWMPLQAICYAGSPIGVDFAFAINDSP